MTLWHVWTDGSCHPPAGESLGWGGWAAVVEGGSDGYVVRGREPATTNVRMELLAAVRGLAAVPPGRVILYTDSTAILSVRDWAARGRPRKRWRGPEDDALWEALADELDRVRPALELLGKGVRPGQHKRAHAIAGAEAKGGIRGVPEGAIPDAPLSRRRKRRNRALRRRRMRDLGFFDVTPRRRRLVHRPDCEPGRCVSTCEVWLAHGAFP